MRTATPWYHGWNIVAVCIVAQAAGLGVMANCFSFFLADWSAAFRVPVSTMVLAITLFSFPCAFFAPVAGWAVDRFSVSRIILVGMAVVAASYAAIGFATQAWHVIAIYILFLPIGITCSSSIPAQSLVSRWFVRWRGFAFSLSAIGLVAAGVIYPPVVVRLMETLGWRWTWWIFAAFNLVVVCALILWVLRDSPRLDETAYGAQAAEGAAGAETARMTLGEILSRRNFWITMAACLPPLMGNSAMSVNLAPFVAERGLALDEAATLLALFSVSAALGKLACGVLADRFGNRVPLFLMGASCTIGLVLLAFAHGRIALGIAYMLLALGQGSMVMVASCIASEFGTQGFSRAYGFFNFSALFGTVPAPMVAYAAEVTHTYVPSVLTLAGLCLAGTLAGLFFIVHPAHPKMSASHV
jgi:Arabinose efflux permease